MLQYYIRRLVNISYIPTKAVQYMKTISSLRCWRQNTLKMYPHFIRSSDISLKQRWLWLGDSMLGVPVLKRKHSVWHLFPVFTAVAGRDRGFSSCHNLDSQLSVLNPDMQSENCDEHSMLQFYFSFFRQNFLSFTEGYFL